MGFLFCSFLQYFQYYLFNFLSLWSCSRFIILLIGFLHNYDFKIFLNFYFYSTKFSFFRAALVLRPPEWRSHGGLRFLIRSFNCLHVYFLFLVLWGAVLEQSTMAAPWLSGKSFSPAILLFSDLRRVCYSLAPPPRRYHHLFKGIQHRCCED